jgi:ketoreductase
MKRAAFVTGGSTGIGLALARMLGAEGYAVTLAARSPDKLAEAVQSLQQAGVQAAAETLDVKSESQIRSAVQNHRQRFGRLDVLVNNAGVLNRGVLQDYSTDQLDELLAVNVRAPFLLYRECLEMLRAAGQEHGQALVLNIVSVAGKNGYAGFGAYCATKFALMGLTQSMIAELQPGGIASCAVCPPVVNTAMGSWAIGFLKPEQMLQPKDVADAVQPLIGRPAKDVPAEILLHPPA